jgi:chromate transporter
MTDSPQLIFGAREWFDMFVHFLSLSLLSVGGTISTAPDMHRFLVDRQHWLSDAQFNASMAIAQSAPGPNVLWVALIGWHIGTNAGSMWLGLLGVIVAMAGILIPSTVLTYNAAQWGHRNRDMRVVRAFKQGMAPIVVALILATSWILALANIRGTSVLTGLSGDWPAWLLTAATCLIVWRTKIQLLWLLGVGALLGWFGLV